MTNGVLRHLVGRAVGPEAAFVSLAHDHPTALWWESLGERGTQRSYLGFGDPLELVSGQEWETIEGRWVALQHETSHGVTPPLGLVGWLAYDLARSTLDIPVGEAPAGHPSRSQLVAVTKAIEWDLTTGEAWLWAVGDQWAGDILQWRNAMLTVLENAPPPPAVSLPPATLPDRQVTWRDTPEEYREKIVQAKQFIRDGEVYQLCLTTEVVVHADTVDHEFYRLLRHHNPAPHQALFRIGGVSMVASSPETFLHISPTGLVTTKPIKGTRRRGDTPEQDREIALELAESEKEQAENLMIVDLMRNDLSRVCDGASVQVPQLLQVESYPSVHQLVSTVTGQLADGVTALDAVKACFPGGSMTGAPKHRAVELLSGLESAPRGAYSGCFGLLSVDGSAHLAMTIRTALIDGNRVSIGVGGGITWSSVIDEEVSEVGHKARAVLRCLGVSGIQYS